MDSAILDKISEGINSFENQAGKRPAKIVIGADINNKIFLEDVLRGHVTKLFDIPVWVRDDCPRGMIYFLNEYTLEE